MDESPSATPKPTPSNSGHAAVPVLSTIFGLLALAGAFGLAYSTFSTAICISANAVGSFGLLGTVMLIQHRRAQARIETLRLLRTVPQIREGTQAIGSLDGFVGELKPIAAEFQGLLREMRQERARIAELEEETRQRIANRTLALERTIGALRQQAVKDGLTGLYNRRMLDAYFPQAIERCRAAGQPLSVLAIDIDFFKPLNDTLGHAAGDQMLKSTAQIIRSTIRESDLAFRCGGDEFLIVFEGANADVVQAIAGRLQSLGDAMGRTFRVAHPPRLSIGVSSLADVSDPTPKALLAAADQRLYITKAAHHEGLPPARTRPA